MPRPKQSPYDTARLIRDHADRGLDDPSRAAAELRAILRLAERLDTQLDHEIRLAERRGSEPRSKPKQAKAVTGYSIEHGRSGIALAEHRSGGTPAFRCPKSTYDLVAKVISDGPESFKFSHVYDEVQELAGEEVPDYQVRVAMRFFTHEALLTHSRARFTRRSGFQRLAKQKWNGLQRQAAARITPA